MPIMTIVRTILGRGSTKLKFIAEIQCMPNALNFVRKILSRLGEELKNVN